MAKLPVIFMHSILNTQIASSGKMRSNKLARDIGGGNDFDNTDEKSDVLIGWVYMQHDYIARQDF